jgi:hypothetical protein
MLTAACIPDWPSLDANAHRKVSLVDDDGYDVGTMLAPNRMEILLPSVGGKERTKFGDRKTTPMSPDQTWGRLAGFAERKVMEDPVMSADQSGLMPANFTTLAHF